MANSQVVVSARVSVYINGLLFGRAHTFEFASITPRRAVVGIDSVDPVELIITNTKLHGQLHMYRLAGDGGAEGAGMTVNYEDLAREKYFTIQLVDRGTDKVLFAAEKCLVTSQTWRMPAKGVVTGVIEFEGILWNNEIKPRGLEG